MTTALYRRYRPDTFAEVIGEEHVTGPLMQALRSGRVNHAYLFSGPRGCGKTTSARILARTLNCARNTPDNPIDAPCGECPSCIELARGGPGSLDVVEIDAASHGGVDDARDLRERATFAPARDRYKIFIIDEAHMVSPAGFNALLKIVEEPPPHIKFVFATTEPDKVIGTIRSRTHHYPFRLVPPDVLGPYLEELCAAEGVTLGGGVVPLVVRAGGGSVRDSLSVLDQLIAGATGGTVDYNLAVGLLGYTHGSLLDDVVDALAARDGASIFRVVDQVIASGHAPQRFVDDLLERLRDLIVIAVSGDAAAAVLRDQPADQLERMATQASRLGIAELSRAADLVNTALTEMTGATSPRLHLELLCARLLLPGVDAGSAGLAARVERLERGGLAAVPAHGRADAGQPEGAPDGANLGGLSGAAAARAALQAGRRQHSSATAPAAPVRDGGAAATRQQPVAVTPETPKAPPATGRPPETRGDDAAASLAVEPSVAAGPDAPEPDAPETEAREAGTGAPAMRGPHGFESAVAGGDVTAGPAGGDGAGAAGPAAVGGDVTAELIRRRWEEIVANVSSPVTRALVGPNAQVAGLDGTVLRLEFSAAGIAQNFDQPRHTKAVEDAMYQTLGVQVQVQVAVDGGARPRESAPVRHAPAGTGEGDDPAHAGVSEPEPDTTRAGRTDALEPARERGMTAQVGTEPSHGAVAATEHPPVRDNIPSSPSSTLASPSGTPDIAPQASTPGNDRSRPRNQPEPESGSQDEPGDPGPAFDEADAAWLAGVSLHEPPAPVEPEPVFDDPPAAASSGLGSIPHGLASVRTPPPPGTPPPGSGQPPAIQAPSPATDAYGPDLAASRSDDPAEIDPYEDSSQDDPDIASSGLFGVPLVVKVLDGTILSEQVDQP